LYGALTTDPFTENKIDYYETDSNGEISFPHIIFSVEGEAEKNFLPLFSCLGNTNKDSWVDVTTSVTSTRFALQYETRVDLQHPAVVEYHMLFLIEVQNSKGEGVPGKFPNSLNLIGSWDPSKVFVEMVTTINEYQVSGVDGIMSVPVKVLCLGSPEDYLILEFDIDGVLLETESIK